MGNGSNSSRSKRKYANRGSTTTSNSERKAFKEAVRLDKLKGRTLSLLNKSVQIRLDGVKRRGVVSSVLHSGDEDYPSGISRKGAYLRVSVDGSPVTVHRRHVKKLTTEENQ